MIPGLLALLAALADQPGPAEGFNLDTRAPVVKVGSGDQTFFGFSVAQHQVDKDRGPVLLVGAPQDNNLQPGTSRWSNSKSSLNESLSSRVEARGKIGPELKAMYF